MAKSSGWPHHNVSIYLFLFQHMFCLLFYLCTTRWRRRCFCHSSWCVQDILISLSLSDASDQILFSFVSFCTLSVCDIWSNLQKSFIILRIMKTNSELNNKLECEFHPLKNRGFGRSSHFLHGLKVSTKEACLTISFMSPLALLVSYGIIVFR